MAKNWKWILFVNLLQIQLFPEVCNGTYVPSKRRPATSLSPPAGKRQRIGPNSYLDVRRSQSGRNSPNRDGLSSSPMDVSTVGTPARSRTPMDVSTVGTPMSVSPEKSPNSPSRQSSQTSTANASPERLTKSDMRTVNSDGRMDNCGYATCAGYARLTIDQYLNKHNLQKQYQTPGLTSDQLLATIQTRYPNAQATTLQGGSQMENFLDSQVAPGQTKKYGLFYTHPSAASGHAVIMKVWKPPQGGPLQGRVTDYQQQAGSARFQDKLPPAEGNSYILFDFGKRNRQR